MVALVMTKCNLMFGNLLSMCNLNRRWGSSSCGTVLNVIFQNTENTISLPSKLV